MIFRDAATSLQGSRLPTCQSSSNIKRLRLPLSKARSIKFGSTCHDDNMVSSGLDSPSRISKYLGESCSADWASSGVSRHQASGVGPYHPTPTPLTKADRAALGTLTNQCLGAATGFGSMCFDNTLRVSSASSPSQIEGEGKEPISSGFATPIVTTPDFVEGPEDVEYPMLDNWPSLQSSSIAFSLDSDSDGLHSTHGVPFVLPIPHSGVEKAALSHIHTWLDEIVEDATFGLPGSPKQCYGTEDLLMNDASFSGSIASCVSIPVCPQASPSKSKEDLKSPPGASCNKENIGPFDGPSSPTRPPTRDLQVRTPSRFRQAITQPDLQHQHTKALRFPPLLTPQGDLSLPPNRKKTRVDTVAYSSATPKIPSARRDFTIHDDQVGEALAQLSPDVERYRKGRGPKRERCMSYWDEDMLPPGSRCVPTDVDGNGGKHREGGVSF